MLACLGAWTAGAFAPIQTERLEIVDSRGEVLIRLQAAKSGEGELEFFDRAGNSIAILPSALMNPSTGAPRPGNPPTRPSGRYQGVGGGHWVSKKLDGGRMIRLEDDSLWEISSLDRINSMLWLTTERVTVIESDASPGYPYKLVNEDSGNTAAAKRVE
jgi:hypothetical protein